MAIEFSLYLDDASTAALAQYDGFADVLAEEIGTGTMAVAQLLVERAIANTWEAFQNPTGALASTIVAEQSGPWEATATVGVPYAARLEFGFSGMTDALGRYYPYWPAEPYLQPALDESQDDMAALWEDATNRALERMATG